MFSNVLIFHFMNEFYKFLFLIQNITINVILIYFTYFSRYLNPFITIVLNKKYYDKDNFDNHHQCKISRKYPYNIILDIEIVC